MKIHLVKLAVGVQDIDHLKEIQKNRINNSPLKHNGTAKLRHITRNTPKRSKELINGGSLFWVIKRVIQVRQLILGFELCQREDGKSGCAIILDPVLYRTIPKSSRAFQGWRYLEDGNAPDDLDAKNCINKGVPDELAKELQSLGLL